MTTETKVEAVACHRVVDARGYGGGHVWRDGDIPADELAYWNGLNDGYIVERAYQESALDALRGEVEDLKAQLAREEHSHGQTIDDRDRAEEALGDMFMAVTGREAEWSSAWDYANAIQEVEEHMSTLTKESP